MQTKTLVIAVLAIGFILSNCKGDEEESVPKNTLSYAGTEYEFSSGPDQTRFSDFECMQWNQAGNGVIYSKEVGMKLVFFNKDIVMTLNLFGESAGKYKDIEFFCNEYKFKTSLIQTTDGVRAAVLTNGSELEITKKSNGKISGNFRLKVPFDANFLNDSIVSGAFEDVSIGAKM